MVGLLALLAGSLPAVTWNDADVGYVGLAGSGSESGGVITLQGSGGDIWGTTDGCHFRSFTHEGDGALVVRVASAGSGHAWAKIGLMMRQEIAPAAKTVMAYATPGNHVGLQVRSETGYGTALVSDSWGALPIWLMLDRQGDVFRAYRSSDGENWTAIGSATVVMPGRILAGVAVTSHDNRVLQVATLEGFMQVGAEGPSAPVNLRVAWSSSTSINLAWDDTALGQAGFEVERAAGGGPDFVPIGTTARGAISYTDTGLSPAGQYSYRVRAVSDSGASAYSNTVNGTTPAEFLAAPSDLRVEFAAATSLQLRWTDNSNDETGFELGRRVQGAADYAIVATVSPNVTTFNDSGLAPGTAYDYRVRAVRGGIYSGYALSGAGTNPAAAGNWAGGDIGAVGPAGTTSVSSDGSTFTLVAGGGDMWGGADAMRMHYRPWSGDGVVTARVSSLTKSDPWAKAGVMIRATFDSTSPNAAMVLTAGNVCGFQSRAAAGGATAFVAGPWVNPSYWVAVSRAGNLFKGFISPDGINWTQVGSAEIAMGSEVFVGLVASAHSGTGAQTTAVFDHVTVPNEAMPVPPETNWTQTAWGGAAGDFTQAGADAELVAQGGDIWGTADAGVFVHRDWEGDATLMARLDGFTAAHDWTKAGLMIRASTAASAPNVFVALTGWHGHVLQTRVTAGAPTTSPQTNGAASGGQWLKLVRAGDSFSGFYSLDDQATWTSLGTSTVAMPAAVKVGLALSSHDATELSTAAFAAVSVQ